MNSIAREKFFSGSAPQPIWMSAIFVIPSGAEESRCDTADVAPRDVSTSRDMPGEYLLQGICRHDFDAPGRAACGRVGRLRPPASAQPWITTSWRDAVRSAPP